MASAIRDRFQAIMRSGLARDCLKLASGSLATQVVAIGTAPIMARLYDPSDYGLLALFTIVSIPISVISTLQFDQAVILPKEDSDAAVLVWSAVRLSMLICAAMLALFLVSAIPLNHFLKNTKYHYFIWMIPLAVLIAVPNVLTAFATAWVVRIQKFGELSASRFFITISSTLVGMTIGLLMPSSFGLLAGLVVGNLIGLTLLLKTVKRSTPWILDRKRIVTDVSQLKKYVAFPKYSVPNVLAMQATAQLPLVLLTGVLGPVAAGLFNMANRLLGLPNTLLIQSFAEVFKQRIAKEWAVKNDCRVTYVKTGLGLAAVILPATFVLAAIAPTLFAFMLGEKWREAGDYSRILCWKFAVHMIAGPLSSIFIIRQKLGEDLALQSSSLALTAVCTMLGFWLYKSPHAIIVGFSIASIAIHSYYIVRGYFLTW